MPRKPTAGLTLRKDGYYVKTIVAEVVGLDGTVTKKRVSFYDRNPVRVWEKYSAYQKQQVSAFSFKHVAELYDRNHLQHLSDGSLRSLLPALNSAVQYFGDTSITEISSADVRLYLQRLQSRALRTVKNYKSVLSQIFDYAIINLRVNMINPVSAVQLPKNLSKTSRQAVPDKIINEIKNTADGEFLLPILILYTGCRCGEACALQWSDIDFNSDTISITKSIKWHGNAPSIGSLKTQNSNRIVPLLAPLKVILQRQKRQNPSFFVVSGSVPLSASQLNVKWTKYCKDHGIAHAYRKRDGEYSHQAWKADIDRHQLRHAYATILWESGIDVKTAQHLLGHANFSTTMDIYTHWKESAVTDAKNKLDDYFSTKKQSHGKE